MDFGYNVIREGGELQNGREELVAH